MTRTACAIVRTVNGIGKIRSTWVRLRYGHCVGAIYLQASKGSQECTGFCAGVARQPDRQELRVPSGFD